MVSKLSLKQRKFWKHYIKTNNLADSAKATGYKGNSLSAYSHMGREILNSLQLSMSELLDAEGLTDQVMAKPLLDGLAAEKAIFATWEGKFTDEKWVPDHPTRGKFLEQYHRLKGNFVDRHELTGKDGGDIILQVKPAGKVKAGVKVRLDECG